MDRNTVETQFLGKTEDCSEVKRQKNSTNKQLLALWLAFGIASISFLLMRFF